MFRSQAPLATSPRWAFFAVAVLLGSPWQAGAQTGSAEAPGDEWNRYHLVGSLNIPPILMGTADFRYIMAPSARMEARVIGGVTPWLETQMVHLSGIRCVEFATGCGGPQTAIGWMAGVNVQAMITTLTGAQTERPMSIYGGAGIGGRLLGSGSLPSRRYHMGVDLQARPSAGVRMELAIISGDFTAFVPSLGIRFALR